MDTTARCLPSVARIEDRAGAPGTVRPCPLSIRIAGLRVRYGNLVAVRGADLTAEPGEVVALLGANGAGKSTTIACLLGLRSPDAGEIEVAGTTPRRAVRLGRVGAMLQISGLPAGAKVIEVVRLAVALHGGRGFSVGDLLATAGLSDVAGREVTTLSGGQAQRVRFAMALAGTPEVLFLDEPTTGMDVESRLHFWDTVRHLSADGVTVLVATHNLAEADRFSDRIVMLARGRVVADGTAPELKARFAEGRVIELVAADPAEIVALQLVDPELVTIHGTTMRLRVNDADTTLRRLYASGLAFTDVTVTGGDLDEAFTNLTHTLGES